MNLGAPIASGNTAEIYLLEGRLLKVFKDHLPATEASYEASKHMQAHAAGLFVPKVLDIIQINGKQAIMMEYIEGNTLGELFMEKMDLAENYMNVLIDVQLRIHKIISVALEPMEVQLARKIIAAEELCQEDRSYLIQKLTKMTYEKSTYEKKLCHGDFHFFNLIVTEDKGVSIIDWVDASSGNVLADVCRTYLLYLSFSEELAELYLKLYCSKSGAAKKDISKWKPILAAARLSEGVSTEEREPLINIVKRDIAIE